ncbi:phosphate/phosphite/phosphonate ABC transporter substrate-binding protein [Streptomyces avicenniae]|uniref:phosphate/phosphite/phosphonate ABC transporter substrate-binding protein n=1 Tax=Streptomyces avicenniae TaxID=500153 RepID=UPI00069A7BAE|nr:phosphate/phosphite/phosphonate ABC transporter substrate-binding protein [Streptomyces avicenniae]
MNASVRGRGPAALALSCLLLLTACGGGDGEDATAEDGLPGTLVLAAIPNENSTDLAAGYEPLIELITQETGAEVEFRQASDYAGVVEGLIAGHVDIAFLGPFAYTVALDNGAEITPLGAVAPAEGVPAGYRSYGLTQGDNDAIDGLADFAGRDVCFVDPGSTSGFLYPSAGLTEAGVIDSAREEDLTAGLRPVYAGGHDASALAVLNGDCEAGFAMESMVDQTLIDSGDLAEGDLKKVWTSEVIPGSLFVARSELGEAATERLTTLFTERANADHLMGEGLCDSPCLLTGEEAWGVVPATDADYDSVRRVCATTRSDKCEEG